MQDSLNHEIENTYQSTVAVTQHTALMNKDIFLRGSIFTCWLDKTIALLVGEPFDGTLNSRHPSSILGNECVRWFRYWRDLDFVTRRRSSLSWQGDDVVEGVSTADLEIDVTAEVLFSKNTGPLFGLVLDGAYCVTIMFAEMSDGLFT